MKQYFKLFEFSQKVDYKIEILAGLTVGIALIPEAVAFALIAGLSPLTGLYAAFMMGLVTAIFGGRPGMISGATGAIAVIIVALAKTHGVEYIFAAVILSGLIQVLAGVLRLGKFIRLVPHPVMFGFVNGLALIIFLSQLDQFKTLGSDGTLHWMTGPSLHLMLGLVLLTMFIIWALPKFTKAIPSSLVAILIIAALVIGFGIDTRTVGDIASIQGGFPPFHIPNVPLNFQTLEVIFPYAAIMAGVGLIESLLTLNLIDEITQTRGRSNKEAVAQGAANILTGLFSGMGGCAMIGQSLINISAGSRARLSGIVAAVSLLLFIMFGASLVEQLPMAALTGLMIMVSIGTFEWASFRMIGSMPRADVFVGILVAAITVLLHNLALAVLIGVIISALTFAWQNAVRIRARKFVDENGVKHYQIMGPLFFGSVMAFNEKFDVTNDPEEVIIDFKESRVADMSGIEALNKLTERYELAGKKIHLKHLSADCRQRLRKAEKVVDVNIIEDPIYQVMLD
ncbi:SulP family inorganic anion transporter [Arundinibacter roseus]|uniref:SulP family inorganic anion transporter n=1 Tax=Arundinibacter roseus TaxID=2070510 RepID=A0A4R4KL63_9BACT|nr:SulP family inorganic anion transporter [Arundinibacter roseus]TDB67311.1 SulP family inorganic anion transporter [Arundinibacter roseus]